MQKEISIQRTGLKPSGKGGGGRQLREKTKNSPARKGFSHMERRKKEEIERRGGHVEGEQCLKTSEKDFTKVEGWTEGS